MLWNWYLCSTVSIFFRTNNFVEKLYDAWMTTRKMYACVWVLMSFTHKVANSLSCFSIKAKVNKQLSDRNLAPFACYYMRAIQYFRWLCFSEVTSLTVWMARIAAIFPAALGHVFIRSSTSFHPIHSKCIHSKSLIVDCYWKELQWRITHNESEITSFFFSLKWEYYYEMIYSQQL